MVASADRHKRMRLAVGTVDAVRRSLGAGDLRLTIVARHGNDDADMAAALAKYDPRGEWTQVLEGVTESELEDLYRSASALLVASIDEGFCLPAAEAAARGLPVVHADRGALVNLVPWPSIEATPPAVKLSRECDERLLATRLAQVLSRPDVWEDVRAANRRSIECADPEQFREAWLNLVREQLQR